MNPAHRLKVYIAGPISRGDLAHNIRQAETAFFRLLKAGLAPFCPHWSCYSNGPIVEGRRVIAEATQKGGGGCGHADWLGADLPWVAASDAVLRLPGESIGADIEVCEAVRRKIPVFLTVDDLLFGLGVPNTVTPEQVVEIDDPTRPDTLPFRGHADNAPDLRAIVKNDPPPFRGILDEPARKPTPRYRGSPQE